MSETIADIEPPRVLIVEPDVLVRHPLAEYLRECGYRVAEAQTAVEAEQLLQANELPIDIVLAEGDTGFHVLAYIRKHELDVQVILAGSVTRATEKAGDLCDDGPAITKPYEHKFVLDRIRQMMAARDRRRN